ncbi:hypothetical protein [Novosphingobium gossypii]|uniref:hypothetical protein n=1 Tax=Novosphingobium gossypii TaxID=1604774 RepID=UPI003D1FED50
MLDAAGLLWPPAVRNPAAVVAAVVVLAAGQPTRRQAAERAAADKVRAACAAESADREARFREARRLTVAHPAAVAPRRQEQPLRSMARREKPRSMRVDPAELEDVTGEEALEELRRRVLAKQAARAPMASEPKIDGRHVAAVHREMKLGKTFSKVPTRRAVFNGECHRCGARTVKGCEHLLPYQEDAQ